MTGNTLDMRGLSVGGGVAGKQGRGSTYMRQQV